MNKQLEALIAARLALANSLPFADHSERRESALRLLSEAIAEAEVRERDKRFVILNADRSQVFRGFKSGPSPLGVMPNWQSLTNGPLQVLVMSETECREAVEDLNGLDLIVWAREVDRLFDRN